VSFAGDNFWRDYTLSLKARKANGSEGFLVLVRCLDPENYIAWNLGGWGNQFHGIISRLGQQDRLIARAPGSIEPGRWYDIRIVLKGTHLDCYLDGQLIQSAVVPVLRTPAFFASATRDDKAHEIIIKAINPTANSAKTLLKVHGVKRLASEGQCILLTGSSPAEENSFEAPSKVAPVTSTLRGVSPEFSYTFQPYSVTLLRLPLAKE
jgi:alpha-L-arabinofuranosidase